MPKIILKTIITILLLGIILSKFGIIPLLLAQSAAATYVVYITLLMAILWMSEFLPLAVTALLPLVLFPLFGIQSAKVVAKNYSASIIMLLMAGAMLAQALQRHKVPEFLAAYLAKISKNSAHKLFYTLIITAALMSMWISNTATAMMLVPIVVASISSAQNNPNNTPKEIKNFSNALFLALAYACNIGGMATPIGTAPNALLLGLLEQNDLHSLAFTDWMLYMLPLVFILLLIMGFLLKKVFFPFKNDLFLKPKINNTIEGSEHLKTKLTIAGKRTLYVFMVIAALWISRKSIIIGSFTLKGWSTFFSDPKSIDDATVAMFGVLLMFLIPTSYSKNQNQEDNSEQDTSTGTLLDWHSASQIPWGLFILFGGGFAIAGAFKSTGLSVLLAKYIQVLQDWPLWALILLISLGMSLLTEVTSNTATSTLLLPILMTVALALKIDPIILMWPATIAASAAFILPIATPPNAIVAGAGNIKVKDMAKVGFFLNAITVFIVTLVTLLYFT